MKCTLCNKGDLSFDVEVTGGCQGHDHGDYCYCDSPDVHIYLLCSNYKCKNRFIKIPTLGDQYSIERWLNAQISEEFIEKLLS
jgi:hypothetical protein